MTYLGVNIILSLTILAVLKFYRALKWNRAVTVTAVILLLITIVFDSLIIIAGIVAYESSNISGIMIWAAPIEDLIYAFMIAVIIPCVWDKQDKEKNE